MARNFDLRQKSDLDNFQENKREKGKKRLKKDVACTPKFILSGPVFRSVGKFIHFWQIDPQDQ